MKKALFAAFLLTGIFSSQASVLIPLDPVPATMNEHFVITLPVDLPLAVAYKINIESLAFTSEEQFLHFCERAGDRLVVVRGNFADKILYIAPQPNMADAGWTVADWNTYLEGKAANYETLYQSAITE